MPNCHCCNQTFPVLHLNDQLCPVCYWCYLQYLKNMREYEIALKNVFDERFLNLERPYFNFKNWTPPKKD
jgi:hypothetical protein